MGPGQLGHPQSPGQGGVQSDAVVAEEMEGVAHLVEHRSHPVHQVLTVSQVSSLQRGISVQESGVLVHVADQFLHDIGHVDQDVGVRLQRLT